MALARSCVPMRFALVFVVGCTTSFPVIVARQPSLDATPCVADADEERPHVPPESDGALSLRDSRGPVDRPVHRPVEVNLVSRDASAMLVTEHLRTRLVTKHGCFALPDNLVSTTWDDFAFDSTGERFVAVAHDNAGWHLHVWSTATGALERTASSRGPIVSLAEAHRFIHQDGEHGDWKIFDWSGAHVASYDAAVARLDPLPNVTYEPQSLLGAGRAHATRDGAFLYDPRASNMNVWDLARSSDFVLDNDGVDFRASALAPDDRTVATGDDEGRVRLWDIRAHREIGAARALHHDRVVAVVFSPDGKLLASSGLDHFVVLIEVESGKRIGTIDLRKRNDVATAVWFDEGGKTLVLGTSMSARFTFEVSR